MLILIAALAQAAPAAAPSAPAPVSAEALDWGKRLAAGGGLATMIPLVVEKDLGELAGEDKTLSPAERDRLLVIGRARSAEALARLTDALGRAYAEKLSLADLKLLVKQNAQPAVARWRAIEPIAIMQATKALDGLDLKKDTAAAFCRETRKLCGRK